MIKYLHSFGGIAIPDYDSRDTAPASARTSYMNLPNGIYDLDGGDLYITPTRVSKRFNALPDSDVFVYGGMTELDNLRRMLGRGERVLAARTWTGALWGTFAKVASFTPEISADMLRWQPVTIEWQRTDAYWHPLSDMGIVLDNYPGFDNNNGDGLDGNTTHQELTTTSTEFTISDTGDIRFVRGHVRITPQAAGSITNISIHNSANDYRWMWAGTLSANESLSIDWATRTVKENFNTSAYYSGSTKLVTLLPTRTEWMWLEEERANDITVECDSITGTVDFWWSWWRHYW